MDGDGDLLEALEALQAAHDRVAALPVDGLTHPDLLTALGRIDTLTRRLPTLSHALLARLQREASPVALGAKSWRDVLKIRLRISGTEATRRLAEATDLGPRITLGGQTLSPVLAEVATAHARGEIGAEHVAILRRFFATLPGWVDLTTREQAEATLSAVARRCGPEDLRQAANRLMALIDQDGPEPDDAERARQRGITIGPQQADGMSRITGYLDPQGRATFEAADAKLGAPGMCNPDDDVPCTRGTPSQAQIDGDTRTRGQRTHDAFTTLGRMALASGELGQHNGLPVTIIVSTTLQQLESGRGSGVTGGGSLLPMSDLIRMASHAHHYLAVFDTHTNEALYLARSKRIAPAAHRIVLHARDRGCSFPGCTVRVRLPGPPHHRVGQKQRPDQHRRRSLRLRQGQPPRRTRLDRHHRPHRRAMEPPTRTGRRASPHQLLPSPRTPPRSRRPVGQAEVWLQDHREELHRRVRGTNRLAEPVRWRGANNRASSALILIAVTGTMIALYALVVIAVVEAVALAVLWRRLSHRDQELAELQQKLDTRTNLISGGREAVKTVWQTANILRKEGFGAAVRSNIEDLADWAQVERPDLARLSPNGRVAILFSDIEESTALNERIGDKAWVRLVGRHDKMVSRHVKRHHGYVVKSQGDGFMIAFAQPEHAVRCSIDMQRELGKQSGGIRVRIGIHVGKSVRRGDDLFGRNVAMAARVASAADGGEVLVSESVRDAVDDEIAFDEGREVELKGFSGTYLLYAVIL